MNFKENFGLVDADAAPKNWVDKTGGEATYPKTACEAVKGEFLGFSHWSSGQPKAKNGFSVYQCTWWANGRGSTYLGKRLNVGGNGGQFYADANGKYNRGADPKVNSLAVYKDNTPNKEKRYGHVAYVEAVDYVNQKYYISHAGSGRKWRGIESLKFGEAPWNYYELVGFVYLDEPLN